MGSDSRERNITIDLGGVVAIILAIGFVMAYCAPPGSKRLDDLTRRVEKIETALPGGARSE